MFPGLAAAAAAHRCSWAALCRLGGGRAATRGRSQGWKNVMTFESFTYVVPDIHPHLSIINQVKLYSTNVQKGGQGSQTPKADKVPSLTQTVENIGAELKAPLKQDPLQVRVKAVLKKRDYGSKYTKNNFITGVRAINEFCLKSSDLEQLRKIRRRSPHDDTESFTVFLRSDVEAKALEVWGSLEALAREKKLRKEAEIEYRERLFRNQRILREYGDFLGNTKAYCILAGSLVSEGATLLVAINELRRSAQAKGTTFYKYVMESRDPSTNVILLEDTAAVLGVIIAATCMGLTSITDNPLYDSLGSLGVGTLLGVVSAFLIYTNTEALLGRSIQPEQVQRLTELLESDPSVRAIHDVKATDLGLGKVRFKAEVDFDGRVVTRSYLEKQDFDQMMQNTTVHPSTSLVYSPWIKLPESKTEIQEVKTPEQLEAFMLKHGENIIDTLGAEVDRLEKELKKRNPEVRHVDLEIL